MTPTPSVSHYRSYWNRPRWPRRQRATFVDAAKRTDPVTGLVCRDAFLNDAEAVLHKAARAAREVAVVSLLVDGLEVPDSRDLDGNHNEALAVIGATLRDVLSPSGVLGRVGPAEFGWICVMGSGNDLAGYVERLRTAIDASIEGTDACYWVGFTLGRGRHIDLDALMAEALERRDVQRDPTTTA